MELKTNSGTKGIWKWHHQEQSTSQMIQIIDEFLRNDPFIEQGHEQRNWVTSVQAILEIIIKDFLFLLDGIDHFGFS